MRTKNFFMLLGVSLIGVTSSFAQWTTSGSDCYLTTTGNEVGIGLTTPTFKLHVVGNQARIATGTTSTFGFIDLVPNTTGATTLEIATGTTGSINATTQIDFKGSANLGSDFRGRMKYIDGSGFAFQTGGVATDRMVITENGYVGIGITPALLMSLHVEGFASKFSSGTGYIGLMHASGGIELGAASGNPQIDFKGSGHLANDFWGRLGYIDGTGFDFYTAGSTSKLRIKEDGKVVIGNPSTVTTPTGYKLYVEEGILTERVKVAVVNSSDWADYVFAPDYKLLSLDSVETYINDNKHLPGIPSSEEMIQNGSDLASTDKMLLEKVENIYLYIIQLNKEIEQLKVQNQQLIQQQDETK